MAENLLRAWVADERNVRIMSFLWVFFFLALIEWKFGRRKPKFPKRIRWTNNLLVTLISGLVLRFVFPATTLGAAYLASSYQFGLFNWVKVPFSLAALMTLVNLDWLLYYQHRLFHAQPLFWKIHRVHHTDLEVDVTTGVRFHPLEALISTFTRSVVILLLGTPVGAVFLFEVILNASSLFNHANIRVPRFLDRLLRLVIVTPDLHRIHHSSNPKEFGKDFGFIFSWWDRFLGTYLAQPEKGQEQMTLGLDLFNEPQYLKGDKILLQPFMDKQGHPAWGNLISSE